MFSILINIESFTNDFDPFDQYVVCEDYQECYKKYIECNALINCNVRCYGEQSCFNSTINASNSQSVYVHFWGDSCGSHVTFIAPNNKIINNSTIITSAIIECSQRDISCRSAEFYFNYTDIVYLYCIDRWACHVSNYFFNNNKKIDILCSDSEGCRYANFNIKNVTSNVEIIVDTDDGGYGIAVRLNDVCYSTINYTDILYDMDSCGSEYSFNNVNIINGNLIFWECICDSNTITSIVSIDSSLIIIDNNIKTINDINNCENSNNIIVNNYNPYNISFENNTTTNEIQTFINYVKNNCSIIDFFYSSTSIPTGFPTS